jgi:hypothetical protein
MALACSSIALEAMFATTASFFAALAILMQLSTRLAIPTWISTGSC